MGKIKNDIPMYTAWLWSICGGKHSHVGPSVEYGAVNSKAAACLHAKYNAAVIDGMAPEPWPVVVRVQCPSGALHEITVERVVEYDYKPAIVAEIEPPRRT